jgi:hypothetical protein
VSSVPHCSSCGAEITWTVTMSGSYMPLDPVALHPEDVQAGDVAVRTRGRVIDGQEAADVSRLERWAEGGMRYFRNHWRSCPSSEQHRVSPQQTALDV